MTTYEKDKVDRIFKMIDPCGFIQLFEETIAIALKDGRRITHEEAFDKINKEYHSYTKLYRYSNFESFKRIKKTYS